MLDAGANRRGEAVSSCNGNTPVLGAARLPLIAAVCNSRAHILAASEPTTVAAYPGDFGAFNKSNLSRCP
eukprot:1194405-Prorocentrum_minimum.AAC.2